MKRLKKLMLLGLLLLGVTGCGLREQQQTPEETIEKIMAVTNSDVSEIIDRVLDISTLSVAAVGPIKGTEELFLF